MDTIKFKKQLDSIPSDFLNQQVEVHWQGLFWKRKANFKYHVFIKNLRVTLYYKELTIENSLHKFYHSNNHKIFTYKQLVKSIEELDNYFDFSIYDADVIKYTPGLVVEAKPENSYLNWIDYKTKEILPMVDRQNTKIYGGYFKAGQIKVKGYNKTYEVNKKLPKAERLLEPLFRLEAEVYARYIAKTYGIPIYKVEDLINYNNYCQCLDLLLKLYDRIKKDFLDYKKLSCADYKIITLFYNKKFSHRLKLYHPHSYKKERAKFSKIIKDKNYQKKDEVREEICDVIHTMKNY